MTVEQINKQEETEIDLIEVIRKLWAKRKFILKVTVVFMALGVLIALFSPKEYTAGCTMVPQIGEKTTGGNLSGLAAMAGINLGSNSGGDVLMPNVYPKILSSVPFQKELMQTEIKFEDYEQPVRLLDYYTGEEYRKFSLCFLIRTNFKNAKRTTKKAANLFQTYCFRWPPVAAGIQF